MPYYRRNHTRNKSYRRKRESNDFKLILIIFVVIVVFSIVVGILKWFAENPILGLTIIVLPLAFVGYVFYKKGSKHKRFDEQSQDNKQGAVPEIISSPTEFKRQGTVPEITSSPTEFRDKFPVQHRADDGHLVRSLSELAIDNWLYKNKISHEYERKLPIAEEQYCDFYIPATTGNVYVEFWGLTTPAYLAHREQKLEVYKKYKLTLLELFPEDVSNLQDKLPPKLRSVGIQIDF